MHLIHTLIYSQVESNRIKNTSVLVFMHGGSNRVGMGSMLEGDILAGHGEIIVVTFNYRLGIYGESHGVNGNESTVSWKETILKHNKFSFYQGSFLLSVTLNLLSVELRKLTNLFLKDSPLLSTLIVTVSKYNLFR